MIYAGPPSTLGTVISGQAQGQASDKCNVSSGGRGVLILVRIVYASDVCNVVKYATVSQPGQGVSSPSLLTAQHFFIGQIQILNTSLKWQH